MNMKAKFISLISIFALMPALLQAQSKEAPADTLAVVRDAHSVIVTKSPVSSKVTVVGQGDDDMFYFLIGKG